MSRRLTVLILGAGKVGRGLHRALKIAGIPCAIRAARRGVPETAISASLLVIAVRDREITPLAEELSRRHLVTSKTAVVHVAGAMNAQALSPLADMSAGIAQMHPMIAFASLSRSPTLRGGHAHVAGDPEAVRRARKLCHAIGLRPRTFPDLDTVAYHAAAGLVANGAAALAAAGRQVLLRAGVPAHVAPHLLGPLLRSVADNVAMLGLPEALTGPVRRGDARGVEAHLATLRTLAPDLEGLYRAMAIAQLPLARAIGDASPESFDALAKALGVDR